MEEELPGPMTVLAVSWMRSNEGDDWGNFKNNVVFMGLCDEDDLLPWFDLNWVPGTQQKVFERDSLYLEAPPREWVTLVLDTPFEYPGTGNLLLEMRRSGSFQDSNLFVYRWYTETYRTVAAMEPEDPFGYHNRVAAVLRIDYIPGTGLSTLSWPQVKSLFIGR